MFPPKSKPAHVKPKSKEVVKPKPKHDPVKPKSKDVVKRSIKTRKRSVNDVVLDDLNVASKEGEYDVVDSDENVASDERDDGDNKVGSVKKGNVVGDDDSDEEDKEYEHKESKEEMESKKESKKGEENNKDDKSNKGEESDQKLVKNLKTKTVKGKTTKGKKKDVASEPNSESEDERAKKHGKKMKVKKNSKKKQVFDSSSSFEEEKPLKKKKSRRRRFSSLHFFFIDTLPSCVAMFVVATFTRSTYEFKLEKGIIRVTPEKVYEILGVLHGGSSIYDLLERPLDDDFVKMWFKKFDPKPLKDIHATDIAKKLEEVNGKLELHGSWRESELHETEGFYEVGDNDIVLLEEEQVHVDNVHPRDGENVKKNVDGEKWTSIEAKDDVEDVVNEAQKE
nr:AP2/B3-like transcriptional factor family protein [Tanacetum cinerariifolium]